MRKANGEVGGIVLAVEEMLRQAVEGALAAGRALPQRLEERQRLDAAFHAQSEDLGKRRLDGEARGVVRKLRHGTGADRADVEGLIADRLQDGQVLVVGRAIAADPDGKLSGLSAFRAVDGTLVARRRGRFELGPVALRVTGPLGLGRVHRLVGAPSHLLVYPDLPGARRIALAVRRGRLAETRRTRGPLGLGTTFDAVRDYVPDDDVRQINWSATARLGRPMANQYRVEQDRDVLCLLDAGRLSAAPIGTATRLDLALDAVIAVAAVAEELGDRCGALAFADTVLRSVPPRRAGTAGIARALYDVEPVSRESDYLGAFQQVSGRKRSFVLVLVDLIDEAAAASLIEAVPVLARRHRLCIATVLDPDLAALVATAPERIDDVYAASVVLDLRAAQQRVVARLRAAGAGVVEAAPDRLATACVSEYLQAKARARV